MWALWIKRLPLTQGLILAIVLLLRFGAHTSWKTVGLFALAMEIAGIVGAWWGVRLQRALGRLQKQIDRVKEKAR